MLHPTLPGILALDMGVHATYSVRPSGTAPKFSGDDDAPSQRCCE
jgi:hypothetical protein